MTKPERVARLPEVPADSDAQRRGVEHQRRLQSVLNLLYVLYAEHLSLSDLFPRALAKFRLAH